MAHMKASTDANSADGVLETYRRWADEVSFTRYLYATNEQFTVTTDPDYAGWRKCYFLGWANSS